MKRKRHTEEQIIALLKEHEAGMKTADLCRKHGISEASFYNWKAKYGGLEISEAKRLRGLDRRMGCGVSVSILAHRINSRQRSGSVAFGAKRTLTSRAYRKRTSEYRP
jgi:putative transposase